MIIRVAPDLCCGHHRCFEAAPGLFELRDGFNGSDGAIVPVGREHDARAAANACPECAIELEGD